jgi:pyruvate/2-oxoglutarate dehydrogenase complex dihydrolipoamide acyltransferase (E2) component
MAESICLLALGDAEEGTISEWYREAGDWVERGEALVSVDVDKVNVDVQAPKSGYLVIEVREGQTVPTGANLGWILEQGEPVPATPGGSV